MSERETYFCDKPDHGWTGFCPCPFCSAQIWEQRWQRAATRAKILEGEKRAAAETALGLAERLANLDQFAGTLVTSPDEDVRDIGHRLKEVTTPPSEVKTWR